MNPQNSNDKRYPNQGLLNRPLNWTSKDWETLLQSATIFSALIVLALFGFLVYFTLPLFADGQFSELFSVHWRPFHGEFGLLSMIVGTLVLAISALLIAYPVGLGICLFVHGLGPSWLARPVLLLIHGMTGVPTVVYGFVAVFLLVPLLRDNFSYGSGFSLLAASLTLSVLILPTVVLLINSQLQQVIPTLRVTAVALGISRVQELTRISLPAASYGLLAAAILGFGRAVGDTLIALMIAGNAAQIPESAFDSIRTLTAHIALVVATDSQSTIYHSLFACGLILFLTTASVNLLLHQIKRRACREINDE
ncbi:MAG: ABC transporter permease subunit [Thermodesulfobacteriota bacterium]|nr:ABC transporter permease subunit [Thermodesulfobacteriota bacterium]